jgi:hypothetical protein
MKLNKSSVVFNSEDHTYILNGKQLSGITSLLDRQLFKDKYLGIPDEVLRKAAERGTFIHQCCELVDEGFVSDNQESINYLKLKEKYNLRFEESEYLVSDNEHVASCIDKVYRHDDTTFFLGDIKTTYKLNKEYVMWQLSIYAYLFEKQNPCAKVSSIFAIWLRGEVAQLVELERVPTEKVEELLRCDAEGLQYGEVHNTMPVLLSEAEGMIVDIEQQLKVLTEQKKALTEGLMKAMVKEGLYSWKGDRVSITRKTASARKSFDKDRFEEDYPGVYENYIKETPVSESLLIKIK